MFRTSYSTPRLVSRLSGTTRPWVQLRCAGTRGRPKNMKLHWTPEKLATSDHFPLTKELNEMMHPSMLQKTKKRKVGPGKVVLGSAAKSATAVHLRTQIVSPRLCDDVLKYMGHTLEKHKGCDILDINPGACLWSQKLHEFLKPRSHILLESSPEIFKPFLDPLLDAPDSKYKLVSKDPLDLATYREIVEDGTFPHHNRVDPANPKAQEVNNTLLVTGSLVWDPRLPGMGFDSMAKQLYHHFASAAWTNDLFHAFGPVRTLFWVQTEDFNNMIAQAVSGMHRANRFLEMTQDLSLIVRSERQERPVGKGSVGREPQYEVESVIRALKAGRELGLKIPPNRQDITHAFAAEIEDVSGGSGISSAESIMGLLYAQQIAGNIPTGLLSQSMIDTIELEKQCRIEYPNANIPPLVGDSTRPAIKGYPGEEKLAHFRKIRPGAVASVKNKKKVEAVADIGEELYLLECKALKMKDGPKKDAIIKRIEDLDHAFEQAVASLDNNYSTAPYSEVDDRISLRYAPHPRIQWDMRSFEPLISQEDEAWPRNRLSLLSATPLPRPVGDIPDWHEWATDFVYGLYNDTTKSLPTVLDNMQHGLSDVIKDCPSLTDPKKGGRMLMKHVRVRMLTNEMVFELVNAYRNWPFKAPGTDHNMYFRHKAMKFGK